MLFVPVGTPPGTDDSPAAAWERLLGRFADLFTRPSSGLFCTLITGWALCPGRRTVTSCHGDRPTWRMRPCYPAKLTPSFADALAVLRRALWARRIFDASDSRSLMAKIPEALIDAVAEAA